MSDLILRRRALMAAGQSSQTKWRFGRYLVVHAKEMVIGENNGVTNTSNYKTYLLNESGLPGELLGFSQLANKAPYEPNEVISAKDTRCYLFNNGRILERFWGPSNVTARAVPGTKIVIFTTEWRDPAVVDADS